MQLKDLGYNLSMQENFQQYEEKKHFPARIVSERRNLYTIYSEIGESIAEVSGKFWVNTKKRSEFSKVGDWVAVDFFNDGERAIIHAVLPRKTQLIRQLPTDGGAFQAQVLGTNIDQIFMVSSLDLEFNIQRIERYITFIEQNKIDAIVILNKSDLPNIDEKIEVVKTMLRNRYPLHVMSALNKDNIEILRQYFEIGKTISIIGSSGVGKSSIINAFVGEEIRFTGEIRASDGTGTHNTTSRDLIMLETGGIIIDNPGMRQIAFWTKEEMISESFADIEKLIKQCYFRNCTHNEESGCAIVGALEDSTLEPKRYENYLKQKREVEIMLKKKAQKENMRKKHLERKSKKSKRIRASKSSLLRQY